MSAVFLLRKSIIKKVVSTTFLFKKKNLPLQDNNKVVVTLKFLICVDFPVVSEALAHIMKFPLKKK